MTKPTDLDEHDDDGDEVDARTTKQKLQGLITPYLKTSRGTIGINY